ncbi:MAG: hypothetical protein HQK96_06190 [Nitrospirae bacterium]|nr:hypothetical protein [Nitrospirota bacterium]
MIERWVNTFAVIVIGFTLFYGAWQAGRYYGYAESDQKTKEEYYAKANGY